jgi:hypothetical protein
LNRESERIPLGKRSPPAADVHLQEPRNAGSRPEAPFFNSLPTLLIRTLFTKAIRPELAEAGITGKSLALPEP